MSYLPFLVGSNNIENRVPASNFHCSNSVGSCQSNPVIQKHLAASIFDIISIPRRRDAPESTSYCGDFGTGISTMHVGVVRIDWINHCANGDFALSIVVSLEA